MPTEPENNQPSPDEQRSFSTPANDINSSPPPLSSQPSSPQPETFVPTVDTNGAPLPDTGMTEISPTPVSGTLIHPTLTPIQQTIPTQPPEIVAPAQNNVTNTAAFASTTPIKKHRILPSKILVLVAVLLLVLGGAAVAYFGYYMNSSTIWSDSLANTGKGYSRLVNYLNTQSTKHYTGYDENGTFNLNLNGKNYDGSLSSQSYNTNSTTSLKLDLGITKLDLEERSISTPGTSEPDLYVQMNGIKGLGIYLGTDFGPQIDSVDGQWISIDHNLLSDLSQQVLKNQSSQSTFVPPSWNEISAFLQSVGSVNQKYLFSTNKSTAVMIVDHSYGTEMINGHKTYHYKIGFVKDHVKAYITALCAAFQQSSLGNSLTRSLGQTLDFSSMCTSLETSAENIKSTDNIDVWTDVNQRLIYQVRVTDPANPAQSFVDLGLDYKGGNSYPFFVNSQSKDSSNTITYSIIATLNTNLNGLSIVVNATDKGSFPVDVKGNFSIQPNNIKLNLTPPANAKPITSILNSLGLSPFLSGLPNVNANSVEYLSPLSSLTASPRQI